MSVLERPQDAVSGASSAYPTDLLHRGETGLCLFAAGFLGANDAAHFADAGMVTTCVDIDEDKLAVMVGMYPRDWTFLPGDAWSFAERWQRIGAKFDVVSVDPFTGTAGNKALDDLPLWCSLARRVVTVTVESGHKYQTPAGWKSSLLRRSSFVRWLVLTRD